MVSLPLLLAGAAVVGAVFTVVSGLRTNIAKARKTGLPYIVTPVQPLKLYWQLTCRILIPMIKMLPKPWWEDWMFIMYPDASYRNLYSPFEKLGDTFLVVSFEGIIMHTASAEVIHQITARRDHFPKPISVYKILDLFGLNVVTTEGAVWRMHRKVTAASFNEKNAAHTFAEAINQTRGLMGQWFPPNGNTTTNSGSATSTATIRTLEIDTMALALNVIGYVGFGLRFLWPGETVPAGTDAKAAKYGSREPPPGFTLSFLGATSVVLHHLLLMMMLPDWLLKILPFRSAREAWEGKANWSKYMSDFLQDKIADLRAGDSDKEGMDIMGQLVRAKYASKEGAWMADDNIIGNAFIMFVAGHETTANTLHFTLLEMANNPAAQRQLQRDIDNLFGNSEPATWGYEDNVNTMLASHLGACINETLRMYPAVTQIPKQVSPGSDQVIVIDGAKHVLPAGLEIALVAVGAARNPRYWPTRPSRISGKPTDLDDYIPDRWFRNAGGGNVEAEVEEEDFGGYQGSDTSAALFRPPRGSYIPFSDGARSCLGRRIALVEMIAALAVIFQQCSVELAVDDWASDDEVARMSVEEKRALYERARVRSRETIREASSVITLKLNNGRHVPIRVVKRGAERFVHLVDV